MGAPQPNDYATTLLLSPVSLPSKGGEARWCHLPRLAKRPVAALPLSSKQKKSFVCNFS